MKNFFKRLFVPHDKNDHRPHFFREASLIGILSLIVALFLVAVSGHVLVSRTNMTALVLPRVLVDYTNQDRQPEHAGILTLNDTLSRAAQLKANDMAAQSYFAHTSPDGHSPWYWFRQVGYDFSYAGENLAVNFSESTDVNTAWMNSPEHRKNILNGNFTEIGIATAEGTYQGRPTTFVVQLFGRPAEETEISVQTPQIATSTPKPVIHTSITSVVKTATTTPERVLATTASSSVLGESRVNELYIAVENRAPAPAAVISSHSEYSNFIDRILLSPKKLLSLCYLVIALLIVIGFGCIIFVQIRRHHVRSIVLGTALMVIMLGLLFIYQSVLFAPLQIV